MVEGWSEKKFQEGGEKERSEERSA